jgi:proteasome lid subunit RPN8/RPN11
VTAKVFFSMSVVNGISELILKHPDIEIGGLLLGIVSIEKIFFERHVLLEAINQSAYHVNLANDEVFSVISSYLQKNDDNDRIIGLWHNHLNGDLMLSHEDVETGREWANYLYGHAVLVVFSLKNILSCETYLISQEGTVKRLKSL